MKKVFVAKNETDEVLTMYPPVHEKKSEVNSFDRLNMLWEKYPQYHERTVFTTLEELLKEHDSYSEDFEPVREEYLENHYERFLVQLSWADLAYRHATMELIKEAGSFPKNEHVNSFLEQFEGIDLDRKACFLFPESYVSQFLVIAQVCKRAEAFHPILPLFPDEEKIHFLAVFDKRNIDDVLLMYHLLYTNTSQEVYGGYSLYDYPLSWYQTHLWEDGILLRSPYLPDRLAKFQGNIPFHHNPVKTVYVRRNIQHVLECGYFSSELEFFLCLTREIMPLFQWWHQDIALYEEKDGFKTDWRLQSADCQVDLTHLGVRTKSWTKIRSITGGDHAHVFLRRAA